MFTRCIFNEIKRSKYYEIYMQQSLEEKLINFQFIRKHFKEIVAIFIYIYLLNFSTYIFQ